MMKKLLLLASLLLWPLAASAGPNGYNGAGSVTRPANTTAYTSGQLVAANTTGNAVAVPVAVAGTSAGDNYVVGARLATTGTGASGAAFKVYLFSAAPTTTALVDQSAYVGPYAADLTSYLGSLTCSAMTATNDGTAQYYSECSVSSLIASAIRFSGGNPNSTIYALVEVTTGYTPISAEKITLYLATLQGN